MAAPPSSIPVPRSTATSRSGCRLPSLDYLPQSLLGGNLRQGGYNNGEAGDSCFGKLMAPAQRSSPSAGRCVRSGWQERCCGSTTATPKASNTPMAQVPDPPRPSCGDTGAHPRPHRRQLAQRHPELDFRVMWGLHEQWQAPIFSGHQREEELSPIA